MDETSTTINELGDKWNVILHYKEGRVSMFDLEVVLTSIHPLCRQSGLPLVCIDSLIDVLFKLAEEREETNLSLWVIYDLMPNEPLSHNQTDRLLHWLKATYHFKEDSVKALIYWFIVSMKIGLVDKDIIIRNYYYSLFSLFLQNPQDNGLNFLLKDLTQTHHITNASLSKLYDCYSSQNNSNIKKQVSVLLKYYIQNCVNISDVMKKVKIVAPGKLKSKDKCLEKSLDSLVALHTEEPSDISSSKIYEDICNMDDSISSVGSIGIKPEYNKSTGQIRVTSLTKLQDLIRNYKNVDAPCNLLSILGGKCSSFYVALSSQEWQLQLEEQVAAVLTMILNNKPHCNIDTSFLFKSLSEVQTLCCQGIPSVTRFLTYYFVSWDGIKYRSEIFELIPWVHFDSYSDLKEFMVNLFEVYLMSDLEFQIKLLDAFGNLYNNVMSTIAARVCEEMHIPFISKPAKWMTEDALNMCEDLIMMFEMFISSALITQKFSSGFLLQTLILYNQIFLIERKLGVKIFTVLPLSVFLVCQTSSSVAVLNLLSLLISRYWRNQNDLLESINESTIMYREKITYIKKYALDTVKLLRQGLGGTTVEATLMGQLIGENKCHEFKNSFGQIKNILSIMKNFATLPVMYELAKKMNINLNTVPPESYAAALALFAPHCGVLFQDSYIDPEDSEFVVTPSYLSKINTPMTRLEESMEV